MSIVSLEEAKDHLRIDYDYDDNDIQLKIDAAEEQAASFLDRKIYKTQNDLELGVSSGDAGYKPMVANSSFKVAVLLMVGHFYENREEIVTGITTTNIKYGFESILYPYRIKIGI